jgi:hypothetical protein
MKFTAVFALRRGKVFHEELFWDHTEALKLVGLSQQDAQAD